MARMFAAQTLDTIKPVEATPMNRTMIALALFAAIPAGAALADDDKCFVPRANWQPAEHVIRLAKTNGWTVRKIKVDDGCYEIEGRDRDGLRIEAKIHPSTLQMIEIEYENDHHEGRSASRNPAPVGTVAPPQNGLFGNGAPPQVQTR